MARRPAAEEGDREWKRTPATYVDYYESSYLSDVKMVRIAFGEYAGPKTPAFFRSAIMMPVADIKILAETLSEWVEMAEKEEKAPSGVKGS